MGTFGDKFRKAREKQGISFDDVSHVIKISSRMLQAIEAENFDQLPGGVFNKGFIRAYAKHLGLDDEDAINEYLDCVRQAQLEAQAAWEPQPRAAAPEKRPQAAAKKLKQALKVQEPAEGEDELSELQLPRAEHVRPPRKNYLDKGDREIPWRIIAVAAVVIALAVILWNRHSSSPRSEAASNPSPTTSAAVAPVSSNAQPVPVSSQASSSKPQAPAGRPPMHPASPVPTTSAQLNTTASSTATPAREASTQADAPLTLVIRASENSWISVTADGVNVSQETLIAPAHTSIRANREIVVKTGNAAGVSFLWNGKEIPAQGAEAEVKTLVFDGGGMTVLPPTQPPTDDR